MSKGQAQSGEAITKTVWRAETWGGRTLRKAGEIAPAAAEIGLGVLAVLFTPISLAAAGVVVGALLIGNIAGRLEANRNHRRARKGLETNNKWDFEATKLGAAAIGFLFARGTPWVGAVAAGFWAFAHASMTVQNRVERWVDEKAPLVRTQRVIGHVATAAAPVPAAVTSPAPPAS